MCAAKIGDVPPEKRREQLLHFMADHDIPLPTLAIYYGVYKEYKATFSYRTTQLMVSELSESGDLMKVDTSELQDGKLVEIPAEEQSRKKAYYQITEQGRERIGESE